MMSSAFTHTHTHTHTHTKFKYYIDLTVSLYPLTKLSYSGILDCEFNSAVY